MTNSRDHVIGESEVNIMTPVYAKKLGFQIIKGNVGAQKIDVSILDTYKMVITNFYVQDKLKKALFFQETFFVADSNAKFVFRMLFLTFSKVNIDFAKKKFI